MLSCGDLREGLPGRELLAAHWEKLTQASTNGRIYCQAARPSANLTAGEAASGEATAGEATAREATAREPTARRSILCRLES
tara:strand:- start:33 stop:278 length:246 start_codon:yes stop_codon:yes gene_type:complete